MAKASKVIYYGRTIFDISNDTVKADKLTRGFTAHGSDGELIEGTNDFDVDSSDATATAAEILAGKTAGIKGNMVTGGMKNNGAVTGSISTKDGTYDVPQGFHDGGGKVGLAETEKVKLISENIRQGVTLFGVEGAMSGTEDANPQAIEITPDDEEQVMLPDTDAGYNYISQVTIKPVPYNETENSAGGITVTIG